MQTRGVIDKFIRPIVIATASKTPSKVKTSIVPGNHVHDISNNESINRSIPPLINRSLPAAPTARVNTTPRLLPISNSNANAKLQQLVSRLSVKIMAVK